MNLEEFHLRTMPLHKKIRYAEEEIEILQSRIKPNGRGHLHTTIYVLKERIKEIKAEIKDIENELPS